MRVTSSLWVGAFIRRSYGEGAPATVVRHGSDEAGAIFVIVDRLSGTVDLYGPAPQSSFEVSQPDDRLFQKVLDGESSEAVSARLEREKRFDSDLWIIAVEDRDGRTFFETVKA